MSWFFLPEPELNHFTESSGFFFTRPRGGKDGPAIDLPPLLLQYQRIVFAHGMNVLTLFSGTGGAEMALHRFGIRMNNVISFEKSEVNRNILKSWWTKCRYVA
ncbi:hypothetical protein SETIT_3G259000v2 [Setaria italica]|uniref:SAM-dependent MTase DRM-type domain-containing protein n=1 Tax=Setaria italica TaxID=4555 RepID=A0A368QKW9_SETIT|nr:hypothetical protein SETIT_3G259000v2 [Setaria italica]